jgi:hypothetical protein
MTSLHSFFFSLSISKFIALCVLIISFYRPTQAHALCGLQEAAIDAIKNIKDADAQKMWYLRLAQGRSYCLICHERGSPGPRNAYGNAIDVLLTGNDRFDPSKKREAGQRVNEVPAYPVMKNSPTFGDLISRGILPASGLPTSPPPFKNLVPKQSRQITPVQARELVDDAHAKSSFGILQLSDLDTTSPEVAFELSKFRGEMLILGITSLSPEVAREFAQSKSATIWFHSLTSVFPESADAISKFPGNLAMTGLVDLKSVSLALKLTRRLSGLALPYLGQITPEIAGALSQAKYGLNLAGLTELSPDCEEKLAATVGSLSLPNLKKLNSLALVQKLASNTSIVLPNVNRLSVDQAQILAKIERPLYGSILLSLAAFTPEIADVFANNPNKFQTVGMSFAGSGPISVEALKKLIKARIPLDLRDVEKLSPEILTMVKSEAGLPDPPLVCEKLMGAKSNCSRCHGRFGLYPTLSLPSLRSLESQLDLDSLLRCGAKIDGVKFISTDATLAVRSLPEFKAPLPTRYSLSLPSLEKLDLKSAEGLMVKQFSGIYLPGLREISTEALKLVVKQSNVLTLGINNLTPEAAAVFKDMYSSPELFGGGSLCFSGLTEMSPEAARELVRALNRGEFDPGVSKGGKYKRSPRLFIGGEYTETASATQVTKLSPALAKELAKYDGMLAIVGLRELSLEAASALSEYKGPRLSLLGPALEKLSPELAEVISGFDAELELPLLELNSVALAQKLSRQRSRAFEKIEKVSAEVIPVLVGYQDILELRNLSRLDSPELAKRLSDGSSGAVLSTLKYISPVAADVILANSKQVVFYLPVLDSVELANVLAKGVQGVKLPRLKAVTPEVLEILKRSSWIETPALDLIHVMAPISGKP